MKVKYKIKKFLGKNFPIFYSKILYFIRFKKKINLKQPTNFNEKLMWLKINNYMNNELVWRCSDKFHVREYALSKGIKKENLPNLLGAYDNANSIPYDKLPNKFALKCSHGCGFNIICNNKKEMNKLEANKKLNLWLNTKFGYESAENHYTHIKPRIIVEEYIDNNSGLPLDYKVYCFNGCPKIILVCSEREKELRLNYYDLTWKELRYGLDTLRNKKKIKKPKTLEFMLDIAKKVSSDFPFVRVDFYEYQGKAILGEMTFTPAQCMAPYYSDYGLQELSKLLDINQN